MQYDIPETFLRVVEAPQLRDAIGATLQQSTVLEEAARQLQGVTGQAILTQWYELFRTGLLSWGLNLSNPNPPFFHIAEPGKRALANATRDPSNPAGYLRHLASVATLSPVTESCLTEGLDCYVAGYTKAAAVMVGAAAESMVLELRDDIVDHVKSSGGAVSSKLNEWKIKSIADGINNYLRSKMPAMDGSLKDEFEAYWSGFSSYIRIARNDAGHPTSIDPITDEQSPMPGAPH